MARRKRDADLISMLRASGLRKKVAKRLADSAGKAKGGKAPPSISRSVKGLRDAASELEHRVTGSSRRSEAAKKAARTRKRNAAKRSATATKAAKTRAKSSR
jgi:hypothetical protein